MVDVVVDQGAFGCGQRRFHGLQLSGDVEAGFLGLDHCNDMAQVSLGAAQAFDDGGMGRVAKFRHEAYTIPPRGM